MQKVEFPIRNFEGKHKALVAKSADASHKSESCLVTLLSCITVGLDHMAEKSITMERRAA